MPLKTIIRNTLCYILIMLQVAAFPALAVAQEAASEPPAQQNTAAPDSGSTSGSTEPAAPTPVVAPATETSSPPPPPPAPTTQTAPATGTSSPTGADSGTYKQNADGTWSNDRYTWDPSTQQTRPNTPQDYSYNPATGRWDTTEYVYSPEQGKYVANVRSSATNPLTSASSPTLSASASANPLIAGMPGSYGINNTGSGSVNSINPSSNTSGNFDLFFNGAISNSISSNAQSGDALVQGNTLAGDAISGDATAIANLLNMLQSSWLGSSQIASFVSTVDGNVFGDLLIDPNKLPYAIGSNNSDIDVNLSNNGVIDNDINLTAQSGDATVDGNTSAGSATSGDARAMANVINMINSAINAGKSFLGMINITGNLNGDILLPPGVLDALISSTGPNSTNTIGGNTNTNVDVNSNANRAINNNIGTNAASGNALVNGNTSAGNATTGSADTSINTLNVVGQNITGKNGLLVFVNVLGRWVGMVVGPSATTATITNTGPASTNNIGPGNSNQSLTVKANEDSLINNDISIKTQSGDATVSRNTSAGNATTGNTDSAVNLLNVIGSNIDVTDWFGVLFINVFGSWFGNFGSDSANGGFSQSPVAAGRGGGEQQSSGGSSASGLSAGGGSTAGQVFGFTAARNTGSGFSAQNNPAETNGTGEQTNQNSVVFGNTTPAQPTAGSASSSVSSRAANINWWLLAGIFGIIATIIVLIREYVIDMRAQRLTQTQ